MTTEFKPMTAEQIRDALAGGRENPAVCAVMALLRGLELDHGRYVRPGQPDLERRDLTTMIYSFQEAQEVILEVIDGKKQESKGPRKSP